MTRKEIVKFVSKEFNVEPLYLFDDDTVVFKNKKKWFGIIMNVSRCFVYKNLDDTTPIDVMNVKLEPEFVNGIKNTKGFAPAYHMNKKHWVSIVISEVDSGKIKSLIKMSYQIVTNKKD